MTDTPIWDELAPRWRQIMGLAAEPTPPQDAQAPRAAAKKPAGSPRPTPPRKAASKPVQVTTTKGES